MESLSKTSSHPYHRYTALHSLHPGLHKQQMAHNQHASGVNSDVQIVICDCNSRLGFAQNLTRHFSVVVINMCSDVGILENSGSKEAWWRVGDGGYKPKNSLDRSEAGSKRERPTGIRYLKIGNNVGRDGRVYLWYLTRFWDELPSTMVFIHGDAPLHGVRANDIINATNSFVQGEWSYHSLTRSTGFGAGLSKLGRLNSATPRYWCELYRNFTRPAADTPCFSWATNRFAQFIVSRSTVKRHAKSRYQAMLEIIENPALNRLYFPPPENRTIFSSKGRLLDKPIIRPRYLPNTQATEGSWAMMFGCARPLSFDRHANCSFSTEPQSIRLVARHCEKPFRPQQIMNARMKLVFGEVGPFTCKHFHNISSDQFLEGPAMSVQTPAKAKRKRGATRPSAPGRISALVPSMEASVDRLRNVSGKWSVPTVVDYPEGVALMGGSVATLVTTLGPDGDTHPSRRVMALPFLRGNMEQIGSMFKAFNILIVTPVNESMVDLHQKPVANYLSVWRAEASAGIASILGAYIRPYPVHLLYNESKVAPEPCETVKAPRICKITRGRNAALLMLERAEAFRSTEFVVVIDSDMCRQWALSNFAAAFAYRGPWVALTANGIGAKPGAHAWFYLDSLAHRNLGENETISAEARGLSTGPKNFKRMARYGKTIFDPAGRPVAVKSAFGGLGIYRMSALRGCRYGLGQCEHHDFHTCLSRKGNVLMFPRLVIEWSDPKGKLGTLDKECANTWSSGLDGALLPPTEAGAYESAEIHMLQNETTWNNSFRVWKDFGQTCFNFAPDKCSALAQGGWPEQLQRTKPKKKVQAKITKITKQPAKKPRSITMSVKDLLSIFWHPQPKGKAVGARSKPT